MLWRDRGGRRGMGQFGAVGGFPTVVAVGPVSSTPTSTRSDVGRDSGCVSPSLTEGSAAGSGVEAFLGPHRFMMVGGRWDVSAQGLLMGHGLGIIAKLRRQARGFRHRPEVLSHLG